MKNTFSYDWGQIIIDTSEISPALIIHTKYQ